MWYRLPISTLLHYVYSSSLNKCASGTESVFSDGSLTDDPPQPPSESLAYFEVRRAAPWSSILLKAASDYFLTLHVVIAAIRFYWLAV